MGNEHFTSMVPDRPHSRLLILAIVLAIVALVVSSAALGLKLTTTSLPSSTTHGQAAPPAMPDAADQMQHHRGTVFEFSFSDDWRETTDEETATLYQIMFSGLEHGKVRHVVGLVGEPSETSAMSVLVVLAVIENPGLVGGLSEAQANAGEREARRRLGERMLTYQRTSVDGMPAVDCLHISSSGHCLVRDVIVFPQEPGVQYLISCLAPRETYEEMAPEFGHLVDSLRLSAPTEYGYTAPSPTPARIDPV